MPATVQPSDAPAHKLTNYRWLVCALLFFATTVNYVDRQILSLIKEILDQELGWSNEDFGRVNGAFQGAYGIGLLCFGWFIDRFGTKVGYAVSITAWSAAALGHALVTTVSGFFIARISLGLGEGGNFPSAIKATAMWFPKKERALATSIFNSGTNVGAIVAPMLVPWIAFTFGWHWAFIAAGVAGLVWLVFWIPLYNSPERIKTVNAAELEHIHSDLDEKANDQPSETAKKTSFFDTSGRAPRASLWGVGLALIGMSIVTAFVVVDLFQVLKSAGRIISILLALAWTAIAFWSAIALQIRRAHDVGKSIGIVAVNCLLGTLAAAGLTYWAISTGTLAPENWVKAVTMIPTAVLIFAFLTLGFVPGQGTANSFGDADPAPGLLGYRQTWSFIVAKFMTDPIWWFFLIWLPDYFKATRGLDIKKSWVHLATTYIIITILSIAGGWVTGYLTKRGWTVTRARKTGMLFFACCVLPILGVTHVGDWPAVFLIALAGSAHQAWSANLYTTVSDMFPKRAVASITGIGGLAGAFMGIYFPIYCGKILDQFKDNPAAGYNVLFSICAFAYLVTFAVHHALAPRFEPVRYREA